MVILVSLHATMLHLVRVHLKGQNLYFHHSISNIYFIPLQKSGRKLGTFLLKAPSFEAREAHRYQNNRLGIFRIRSGGLLDHPYAPRHPPSAPPMGERQGVKIWYFLLACLMGPVLNENKDRSKCQKKIDSGPQVKLSCFYVPSHNKVVVVISFRYPSTLTYHHQMFRSSRLVREKSQRVEIDKIDEDANRKYFLDLFCKRRPLSRQGRPTGIRISGSASSAPGAGVCQTTRIFSTFFPNKMENKGMHNCVGKSPHRDNR